MNQENSNQTATAAPKRSSNSHSFWALWSGVLGAAASCFAKLAFSSWSTMPNDNTCPTLEEDWKFILSWLACHLPLLLPRLVCLLAMVLCNAAMVACFVGGLQESGSIAGTALATAANFITSVAAGYLIWPQDEKSLHVTGLSMVILGAFLLVWAQKPLSDDDKTTNKVAPKSSKQD